VLPLSRDFYARDALVVARALIGTFLVYAPGAPGKAEPRVARIVETEAYRGPKDLACHARAGLTKRTRALFGPPGHAYVFFVYGMHECFNVVCFGEGTGHAVLVRGVEPTSGIAIGTRTDGPGRVTRALGITRANNGQDLFSASLFIAARTKRPRIEVTARVGVGYAGEVADAPWRFLDPTSRHVSRPAAGTIGRGLKATPRR
jgi:DNA-3-methyladenine glycosylase